MIAESFCFLAVLFGMVGFVVGDELQDSQPVEKPGNIELTTEHVVIFKDGYCLVVKDGMAKTDENGFAHTYDCLLYTSPSPRDKRQSRMPSSA